jgi:hypothetical protein
MRIAIATLALIALGLIGPAFAGPPKVLKPGQYELSPEESICLKDDATWYGVNYVASGMWINGPVNGVTGVIFGNYGEEDGQYNGYGNVAVIVNTRFGYSDWWDWHDDFSYQFFEGNFSLVFEKTTCDPPATKRLPGRRAHAPWMPHRDAPTSSPDDGALTPGQYLLAGKQKICLKGDGTWYGINKTPYSGQWLTPPNDTIEGVLYGNYGENLGKYQGFGNVVILVTRQAHETADTANWLDWRDNLSHTTFTGDASFSFVRAKCAPAG